MAVWYGNYDTCEEREFPEVWEDAQRKIHEYFPFMEDGEVPALLLLNKYYKFAK